jgi:hypothetical protein
LDLLLASSSQQLSSRLPELFGVTPVLTKKEILFGCRWTLEACQLSKRQMLLEASRAMKAVERESVKEWKNNEKLN